MTDTRSVPTTPIPLSSRSDWRLALPVCTLAASIVGLAFWFGGPRGLLYLALYLLALLPGLPLGWQLFGRRHPAGWIAGALIGYSLTALAFWLPMALGWPHIVVFAVVWTALTGVLWRFCVPRGNAVCFELPGWTQRDTATWLLLLHLVPLLLALPLGRVGEADESGTRYYRAYFTADFIWHTAMTQEMARFGMPPTNPYLAPDPIHYYWTYFAVPAVLAGPEASPLIETQPALKITATGTALLLFSAIFFAAWSACGRARSAAMACALALLAASFEGTYEIFSIWQSGGSFDALRDVNIDAITAWTFQGLRIDGLVRSMWYTPQHSMSIALGLIGMLAGTRLRNAAQGGSWLVGIALALSLMMSQFLGAVFCAIYGLTVVLQAIADRSFRVLWRHSVAAVPVVFGLAWGVVNRMSEGAAGAVTFGWLYTARNAPILTFVLSFGGILIPALAALWPRRRESAGTLLSAIAGLTIGLFLLYFVTITERAWVGFRAGNVLLVTFPMLAARGLTTLVDVGLGRFVVAASILLLLIGSPTTVIDAFNAQDIENRRMGPGFLWTIPISPAQQAGFRWLRESTPIDAVVQADPIVRGRQNWSAIPTFAGRRSAAGLPISLLAHEEYERRSQRVHDVFTTLPVVEAHRAASEMGIDYLWLDDDDGATAQETMSRFMERPDLFALAFRVNTVAIYQVR